MAQRATPLALTGPVPESPRKTTVWARQELPAHEADASFYRICGKTGAGKTHLVKLFIQDVLREVEANPYAKLVIFEPKREFYAWLKTLNLTSKITYFFPSDTRSVSIDWTADYRSFQDSETLAYAFHPERPHEAPFWGETLRAIYAGVYWSIREKLGRVDLRLVCGVLDNEQDVFTLLGNNPYLINAQRLARSHGKGLDETAEDIQKTIHARMAKMKILAAHLERCSIENGVFSLRRFVEEEQGGIFVISRDDTYATSQDGMNSVVFGRLMELLDSQQPHPYRKVFIVIDEFHQLAGELPCQKIARLFLLLRSRGATGLLTYQALTTLKKIYGDSISDVLGQCGNVIHLKQSDNPSAEYAANELGKAWMTRNKTTPSISSGRMNITRHIEDYYDFYFDPTQLLYLPEATPAGGVSGVAKSTHHDSKPWAFNYPGPVIDKIPKTDKDRFPEYLERPEEDQMPEPLTKEERLQLGLPVFDWKKSEKG